MGRSILVSSGKGGSGKTTFAIALAITLARRGYKICLTDLNFGLRNLDIYLGLEDKVIFDIGDIMAGVCKVEKALIRDDKIDGLYLLESTQNKLVKGLTAGHVKALISQLKKHFDYVIIDSPYGVDESLNISSAGADSAVLVATPDQLALRNTEAVNRRLDKLGVKSRCFVINMLRPGLAESDYCPGIESFTKAFDIPLAGMIPYDENIHLGNNAGRPVFLAEESYIARNMDEIVIRMLG